MSESLTDIYPAGRYQQRRAYRKRYRHFAQAMWELWRPAAVLDLGCGAGWLVEWFAEQGIPTLGIDGSEGALQAASEAARPDIMLRDLREPPPPWIGAHEFVCSIEAAEHIEPEAEAAYLRWFTGAQRIFLTAAPPGQGGHHHVNEQPPEHWIEALGRMGYRHRPDQTERWRCRVLELGKGCGWVRRNAMFFTR